jgi:hypothetical protein
MHVPVDAKAAVLLYVQVIERLTERRIVVEKAVSTLGEAPTGLRDVFELCRGFEKAFSNIVNVSVHSQEVAAGLFLLQGWQQSISSTGGYALSQRCFRTLSSLICASMNRPDQHALYHGIFAGVTSCQQDQGGLLLRAWTRWQCAQAAI